MLSNLKKKILIQFFLVLALIVIVLVTYSKLESEKLQNIETSQISEDQIEKTDATNIEEEKESIIKNVKYVSRGIDGSEFKIEAETGSISKENTSIMLMKNVKAEIILKNQKKISLTSKMAKYNIINSNTNFYDNVNTKYLQNELKSRNLELNFDENMIYMFENTLKNHEDKSELQAKIIKFDVIKKKFEILSKKDDKIKFIKKN